MGWHPISPEFAKFPNPPGEPPGKIIKGKRASNSRGTRLHSTPKENKGPKKRHYTSYLVENAMKYGYRDGIHVGRKK